MTEKIIRYDVLERIKKIPIVDTLGFEFIEMDSGICEAVVKHQKKYDGIYESFHGGLLMTVADSISAFALLTLAGSEAAITTTDMNIRFLAACRTDVRAIAKVIKHGRTLAPVAVDMFDMNGVHVAVAQVNYIILTK
ncbi:MAG TPA: PaaI family thioesterase [Ignavibacteria bacterium]|nr:PaaI family thioesterase [Ignavibacteria bacterium]